MSSLTGFVKSFRDIMRMDPGISGDAQRIEQIAWLLFLKVYDAKEADWELEDDYRSIIPDECRWSAWAKDDRSGAALTGDKLLEFVDGTLFPTLKNLSVSKSTPPRQAVVKTVFSDVNNYMKNGILLRKVVNLVDSIEFDNTEESRAFGDIYESILKELQSAGSAGEFYTPRAVTDFMARIVKPKIGETMADYACGTGGFITSWLTELYKQVASTKDQNAWSASIRGVEKKPFPYILCVTNLLLHDADVPNVLRANALTQKNVLDYTDADKTDVILMNPPYGGSETESVKSSFPTDLANSETADLFMSVVMYRLKENGRAAIILPDGFLFGVENVKVNIKKKLLNEFNLHTIIRLPGSVFAPYTSITTNILFFDKTGATEETWFYRLDMPEGYKHFSKTKPIKSEHFQPVVEWWNDRKEIEVDGFPKAKKFSRRELSEELGYNFDQCGYPNEEKEILDPLDLIKLYEEERASLNAEIDRALQEIVARIGDVDNGQPRFEEARIPS